MNRRSFLRATIAFPAILQSDRQRPTIPSGVQCGDVAADLRRRPEVRLPDGRVWKNLVSEAKSKVAETLDDFRGNYAYNLMDEHARRFNAQTPMLVQWDDHEVRNNWFPGQVIDDARYTVKDSSLLATRAKQAMFEYAPIRRLTRERYRASSVRLSKSLSS
jgi:alkaline phosphatase D